jgi:arginine deiminase
MAERTEPSIRGGTVPTDVGTLRRILVHTPGPEIRKMLNALSGGHPMLPSSLLLDRAMDQHRNFVALLEADGAKVLQLEAVLDEAVEAARTAGILEVWLQGLAPQLVPLASEVSGAVLLGAVDRFTFHTDPDGTFSPLVAPAKGIMYTRDLAIMTPRGVVISNFVNPARNFETALIRLAFEWSPSLRDYPLAFDAREERLFLQGGDVIVADERTLFIGVGNLTEEAAARRLARRLEMDVVAVQLPAGRERAGVEIYKDWHGLRSLFLHLDSVFNMVDRRRAVAVPLLLEAEHAGRDPLYRIAAGLARTSAVATEDADELRENLEQVGRIRRFLAGSGEEDSLPDGIKLLDHLRDEGWEIVPVGGEREGEGDEFAWFVERVMRELYFQAANVVATAPGRVIACAENEHTLAALRDAGVELRPFEASEIVRWGGGPHCLSLPLERDR